MESSETKTNNLRQEDAYTDPAKERRRELGELVIKYKAANQKNSIQGLCAQMHPHCETISEAMFIGAFIDFMLSEGKSREERIETVKQKIAEALVGDVLGKILEKAFRNTNGETKETAPETKESVPEA